MIFKNKFIRIVVIVGIALLIPMRQEKVFAENVSSKLPIEHVQSIVRNLVTSVYRQMVTKMVQEEVVQHGIAIKTEQVEEAIYQAFIHSIEQELVRNAIEDSFKGGVDYLSQQDKELITRPEVGRRLEETVGKSLRQDYVQRITRQVVQRAIEQELLQQRAQQVAIQRAVQQKVAEDLIHQQQQRAIQEAVMKQQAARQMALQQAAMQKRYEEAMKQALEKGYSPEDVQKAFQQF